MSGVLEEVVLGRLDRLRGMDGESWSRMVSEAAVEEMEGLLYYQCQTAGVEIPSAFESLLRGRYRAVAERNFVVREELEDLLDELGRFGLELMVLPGAALLPWYPDPGCRPMDDVDLLVAPGTESAVKRRLRTLGFRSPFRHPDLFGRGPIVLDLHVDLLNSRRIRSRRRAGWIDPEEVWRDRICREDGLAVPCVEDMVLYTAVHALRHSYRRLTWFVDLYLLLKGVVDWERLVDKAFRYRMERPLVYGLRLLRGYFQCALPPGGERWIEKFLLGKGEGFLLKTLLRQRRRVGVCGDLLWSFSVPGFWNRCFFLAETFFPRPEVLLQVFPRLPGSLFPLAYVLRTGQLACMGGKALAGMMRRS